jgi:hypothetical protein
MAGGCARREKGFLMSTSMINGTAALSSRKKAASTKDKEASYALVDITATEVERP